MSSHKYQPNISNTFIPSHPNSETPTFVVPSGKKTIKIVTPSHHATQPRSSITNFEAQSAGLCEDGVEDGQKISGLRDKSASYLESLPPLAQNRKGQKQSSTEPKPDCGRDPGFPSTHTDNSPRSKTTLDVLAKNYVPSWLKAVNESHTSIIACQPLDTINFDDYVSQFCGRQSLESRATTVQTKEHDVSDCHTMKISNYQAYWTRLQKKEFGNLHDQLFRYRLYNVPCLHGDVLSRLYYFKIPGLRDDAPRIDLGDVVQVRPLVRVPQGKTAQEISPWYVDSNGFQAEKPASAFSGSEYQAIVWGIARGKEEIMLRIDQFPSYASTFNLIFRVQAHKVAIYHRAVSSAGNRLQKDSSWMRSMLFPSSIDARVQTTLTSGHFNLEWYDSALNFEQKKAVASVVKADYGNVPFLISGPPGTGKTKTLVETALQLLRNGTPGVKPHLLICAPSDAAADTLAKRLSRHLSPSELFRLNGWTRAFADVPGDLTSFCYSHNDLFSLPNFKTMMASKVTVTTCRDADMLVQARLTNDDLEHLAYQTLSSIAPAAIDPMPDMVHWTALLLDEAAQATEPETLVPLMVVARNQPLAKNHFQPQVIMAGDEFQLGPRLSSQAEKNGLEISLFQRLFARSFYASHPLSRANGYIPLTADLLPLPRPAFVNLIRNYRSHPSILTTSSSLFYHNTLIPERETIAPELQSWAGWKEPYQWPVLFHQNLSPDSVEDIISGDGTGAGSLTNTGEVEAALAIVKSLIEHCELHAHALGRQQEGSSPPLLQHEDIMVMSPFRAQVSLLRTKFRKAGFHGVNIGPVEAFQGLESRIVILCTTRTYPDSQSSTQTQHEPEKFVRQDQSRAIGIIDEPKRFNVAITRAKEGLIVLGDARTLTCTGDPAWEEFISFCHRNGCVTGDDHGTVRNLESNHRDIREGQLEKALKFAADNNREIRDVRRLGMRVYDQEERMWMTSEGMVSPRMNGDYDEDEYDADDDCDELDSRDESGEVLSSSQGPSSVAENSVQIEGPLNLDNGTTAAEKADYDRDLELELMREGCATQ